MRMTTKQLLCAFVLAPLVLTGCGGGGGGTDGGGGSPPPPGNTANQQTGTVNPTGTASARQFAYVTGQVGTISTGLTPAVFACSIDSATGGLTRVGTTEFPFAAVTVALAAHPSGKFLFVAGNRTNDVSSFRIDPLTGTLTLIGTVSTGVSPASITADPNGNFIYVTSNGSDNISYSVWSYRVNSSGELTPVGTPAAAGYVAAIHPSGKFAYLNDGSSVRAYSIDSASGAFSPMGPSQTVSVNAVHPSGNFAYGTRINFDAGGIEILAYSIGADGALTTIGSIQKLAGGEGGITNSLSVATGGKFVYVLNDYAHSIATYTVSPTGTLSFSGMLVLPSGSSALPSYLATEPGRRFAYVGFVAQFSRGADVSVYSIDPASGNLSPAGTGISSSGGGAVTIVGTSG